MARKKKGTTGESEPDAELEAETAEDGEEVLTPKSRLDSLVTSELFAKIRKEHGKSILTRASDFSVQRIPRIPSGITQLDYALGGGWAAGRINIAYGHKSTGKTQLFLRAMAEAQKLCATCWTGVDDETGEACRCGKYREPVLAFLDVEGTWDAEWARCLGVDDSRVLLSVPDYAEQTLDIAEALVRSTEVDVLVIDSIAFLTPAKEIEESSGKALQAEQARTLGRGIRKFVSAINYCGNKTGRRPTLFFTNQIRTKMNVMYGNPETTSGGFAPGFAATTEVRTSGGTYEMDDVTGKPLWVDLKFKVDKNKSSGAKMEGEYRVMLSDTETKRKGEVYDELFLIEMGVKMGLIVKEGGYWQVLGESYRSKDALEQGVVTNLDLKKKLRKQLMVILMAGQ